MTHSFVRLIFNAFTRGKRPSMAVPELAGDKVMHGSQAPEGNTTNVTPQPPSGPIANDRIIHAEENLEESPIVLKGVIEKMDPLPLPSHIPNLHVYGNRLHALIIGINDYLSLPKLSGAVNDAKAIAEFLELRMNVPPDHIRLLLDRDASRKEIINAFVQLSEEKKIEIDDPILIYYAGHGSQLPPPENWEAGGAERQIQVICPCNYADKVDHVTEEVVHAIPDRTIGALLDLICERKGNNITVIFDCCHSSSGTRMDELSTNARSVALNDKLPLDLDLQELSIPVGRGSVVASKFGRRGLGSHVLVAACKETETAKEDRNSGRGRFTAALLELFDQEGLMETLTYTDILKYIKPIQGQNPQVEGIYRDRIIFDAKEARRPFYSVRFNAKKDIFILDAGSAHGIARGSLFTIYEDNDSFLKSCPWGSLLVTNVMRFTSSLQRSEGTSGIDLKKPGIAVLSVGGADQTLAMIASYEPEDLPPAFLEAIQRMEKRRMISLVTENAQVEMRLHNGHLIFNILDPIVNACGLDRVYHTAKPTDTADDVVDILSAGCNFFWHLRRGHDHPIVDDLKVEFMELQVSTIWDKFTQYPVFSPIEENLLRSDGIIDLRIGLVSKPYGIKLTNNSVWNLFAAVFYFDHSDWSIGEFYHPGTAGQFEAEAPLRKQGGTLTIGYGAGGRDPISFLLNREHQDFDVGHLKIFFSTKAVDLRPIQQDSPFIGSRNFNQKFQPPVRDIWMSLQYPIIQRRA